MSSPRELHDKFQQYPFAPETIAPNAEGDSDFQSELAMKNGIVKNGKNQGGGKLIPHLHYSNLEYLEKCGVKITRIIRVLFFKLKKWLAPYTESNNAKRKAATNDFENGSV